MSAEMQCGCGGEFKTKVLDGITGLACSKCQEWFVGLPAFQLAVGNWQRRFAPTDLVTLERDCEARREELLQAQEERLYRNCPMCATAMARRSFARESGIIVHQCAAHGYLGSSSWLSLAKDFIVRGGEILVLRKQLEDANSETQRAQRSVQELEASTRALRQAVVIPLFI